MHKKNILTSLAMLLLAPAIASAQLLNPAPKQYTRADTLRGTLSELRSCYDIQYYHLDIKVDIPNRSIAGSNLFKFTATQDFKRLQFDLFDNMKVDYVLYRGKKIPFKREFNAVFVDFPQVIEKGKQDSMQVFYSGRPLQANRAPWDGGFDWKTDSQGKPWIATACQGLGASAWWPTKDHQSDEVDSMLISVAVPSELMNISNGRLRGTEKIKGGFTKYHWFVSNPINNYNVALNIGDYKLLQEQYAGEAGVLDLSYYVLRSAPENAFPHLSKNTHTMLKALEYWFGPYPWYSDGYKLVETSHLGMEHQSAIAYGNKFMNGYLGRDGSGTGHGLKWDFIVIHESGHEWFGNNITAKDITDMWIHESFTNYSEALFIEYYYGKEAARDYLYGNRRGILNDRPMYGMHGVNQSGSGDMYNKGGVFMHQIRQIINDDTRWREILRGLNKKFYHQTVDYADIVNYINQEAQMDLTSVFEQYVKQTAIPRLEVAVDAQDKLWLRWKADVPNFQMPIAIKNAQGEFQLHTVGSELKLLNWPGIGKKEFEIDSKNFYVEVLLHEIQAP